MGSASGRSRTRARLLTIEHLASMLDPLAEPEQSIHKQIWLEPKESVHLKQNGFLISTVSPNANLPE
jgi:hypothetical protein